MAAAVGGDPAASAAAPPCRRLIGRHPVTTVPSPPGRARNGSGNTENDVQAVLRIPEFRRLWAALALSSLGDWMGLLATTALATQLRDSFSGQAFALGSLLIVRLMPALLFGPLAGAIADKLDRRLTMVVADVIRFGLFVSIPIVGTLEWLLIASFLVECVSLMWSPAKDASVPNLVPEERLPAANTLSLITTYGTAPIAAAVFALLATMSRAIGSGVPFFRDSSLDIALYFNAATFLVSAAVIFGLRTIGRAKRLDDSTELGFWASITEGWRFVGTDKMVRGLVVGILGGFAGAGCIIALGRLYVQILGGGDSAYGILFGAVFVGLAAGMALGPKLLGDYSRRRLFGLAVTGAGVTLVFVAVVPNLVVACILVTAVGAFAGIAWVTGYTLLQAEVADELRGRTFALVQSLVRIDLLLVLAAAPAVVGLIGPHKIHLWGEIDIRADGVTAVMLAGGLLAVCVGLFAYRQMDERAGIAILPELWNALRGRRTRPARPLHAGLFVAIEGCEGTGKSTQVELLRSWLASAGREVVVTCGSGGTALGTGLRAFLLDPSVRLHARTEALLNAADRAEHVARVIEPALARGAIVVSDGYIDSSVAYQGARHRLGTDELSMISQWASHALLPDITFLLDAPHGTGLERQRTRQPTPNGANATGADAAGPNPSQPRSGTAHIGANTAHSGTATEPSDRETGHTGPPSSGETNTGTNTAHSATHSETAEPTSPEARRTGPRGGIGDVADGDTVGNVDDGIADDVDADCLMLYERARNGFRRLADTEPGRYVTLDARLSPDEIHMLIRSALARRLDGAIPSANSPTPSTHLPPPPSRSSSPSPPPPPPPPAPRSSPPPPPSPAAAPAPQTPSSSSPSPFSPPSPPPPETGAEAGTGVGSRMVR